MLPPIPMSEPTVHNPAFSEMNYEEPCQNAPELYDNRNKELKDTTT